MTSADDRAKPGTALVTGGGSGIGRATALLLAARGATVVVADIDRESAEKVAAEIERAGGASCPRRLDVTDAHAIEAVFSSLEAADIPVDVLVNSAGLMAVAPLLELAPETFARVMQVNVTGTFMTSQRAARTMMARGYGRIVNLSSVSGQRAGAGRVAYGTSKTAIMGLTRQFALEAGAYGVTCNAIAPGVVETPMTQASYSEKTWLQVLGMIPSRRFGQPHDIAEAIAFLASPAASYINGETIFVDGGYNAGGMTQTGKVELD